MNLWRNVLMRTGWSDCACGQGQNSVRNWKHITILKIPCTITEWSLWASNVSVPTRSLAHLDMHLSVHRCVGPSISSCLKTRPGFPLFKKHWYVMFGLWPYTSLARHRCGSLQLAVAAGPQVKTYIYIATIWKRNLRARRASAWLSKNGINHGIQQVSLVGQTCLSQPGKQWYTTIGSEYLSRAAFFPWRCCHLLCSIAAPSVQAPV